MRGRSLLSGRIRTKLKHGSINQSGYTLFLLPSCSKEGDHFCKLDISAADLQRPRYFRSFLAICAAQWVAGVSLAPTHLHTLGQTLVGFFQASQWQCDDVVNLAGDRQAVLLLATGDQTIVYHGDPMTYKASLLG